MGDTAASSGGGLLKPNPRWRMSLVVQGGGFPLSFPEEASRNLTVSTEADGVRRVLSGTMDSLVEMLFARKEMVDIDLKEFVDIFLITHPILLPSEALLDLCLNRYVYFFFLFFSKRAFFFFASVSIYYYYL